jgi:protein SCO1
VRVALTLATIAWALGCEDEIEPPPTLLEVPAFTLTSQRGEPHGSEQLAGKVWIANFVFTRCPTVCPLLTTQMARLTERLEDTPVRFVSFSVDPANDSPEVLAAYAEEHGADTERWSFLTGDNGALEAVVVQGLRVHIGERDERGNILHGTHFVLVDGSGHIRGYYQSNPGGLDDLVRDARQLVQ